MRNISQHLIPVTASARTALRQLESLPLSDSKVLFAIDGDKLVGTLTDGDIRRGLLKGLEISHGLGDYINRSHKKLLQHEVDPASLEALRQQDIWMIPVIDNQGAIIEVIDLKRQKTVLPVCALIMAGGRGERLRPLTDAVPKPMLKVGEKPILEHNINWLRSFGIKKVYISLRYLPEVIKDYFGDGSAFDIDITYLEETTPLGTFGSCSLIEGVEYSQMIVMNADILTNIDFGELYRFAKERDAEMCVASIPYKVNVPYGIFELGEESEIAGLAEKPTYTYYANAGIYLVKSDLLKEVPRDTPYNATDLMQKLIDERRALVNYPIVEYWLDIGKYDDYVKAQQDIKHLSFK